ncbi:MAG: ATP-binding protein [Cyanobacteria bacterium J06638_28]
MIKTTVRNDENSRTTNKFLKLFLPLTALVGTGFVSFYQIQANGIRSEMASAERREIEVKSAFFANRFSDIRADLMILSGQHELRTLLEPISSQSIARAIREALGEEYLVVSQQKQLYDQIRFLDTTGQEVVRVNFNQGQPSIVPDEELQNQAERYWFKDTIALQNGEVFISPLDLNIELGKIEQPLKPMIRFGTPVLDAQGNKRGIVVLNYLAQAFLQNLSPANFLSSGDILLLNAEGYWLKGSRPEDEWGFMYDDRQERTFANVFPEAWQQIQSQKTGQFRTNQGLYTFTTIYPFLDIQVARSSTGSGEAAGASRAPVNAESYAWKLVTHVPTAILVQRSQSIRNQLLFLFAGFTAFIAMGSWLLMQAKFKHQKSEQQAKGLEETLLDVHQNQAQLIQTEKMASLGQLVSGIAHEINNPVNFIHGNLRHADDYVQNLLDLIQVYQKHYPEPVSEIDSRIEDIELDFIQEDLPQLLSSMRIGSERIREIVLSLRNFSRIDESECKAVDIHEGLESTLLLLKHRIEAKPGKPSIKVVRDYSDLPLVECYPGQLNQVFMNILANAIDALTETNSQRNPQEVNDDAGQITIRTTVLDSQQVEIAIADNGLGMPKQIQDQIFTPFFTTKSIGKGTGMGMTISYQITTEKHGGKLLCFSSLGEGTEFVIQLPLKQADVLFKDAPKSKND